MNVVIYARFSSHNQTEASIEGQLKVCYEYCQKCGYTVIHEYIDRAKTGKTVANRDEFQKMIKDSSKKHFEAVIVYALDRFGRNLQNSVENESKLNRNDVKLLSASENFSDNSSGRLHRNIMLSFAAYYSDELSDKIRRGQKISAEKFYVNNGNPPLGYKTVNKKYVIDEEKALYVRKIFQMYVKGETMLSICDYLNGFGLRTSKNNNFTISNINKILLNERYMGTYIFKGEKTPNAIPAIVSAELFNEVAAKMNKNKKASAANKAIDEKFILTTKLFCGHCGTGMSGTSGTGKSGKRFHYYICMAVKKKSGCKKKSVSQAWIEDLILSECRKALTDENISLIANEVMEICEKEKDRTEYNRLEKTYKDMDKKKANLVNSLQNTENENLQKMIYEQFEVLDRQQVEIKKEMLNQENMQNTLSREMILFFLNDLKNGDINDFKYRELLVNIFVNKIYLFDDKITIVFNTQGETVDVNIEFIESFGCSDIKQSSPYKLITFKSA